MTSVTGRVVDGRVVVEDNGDAPEAHLTTDELAELDAAIAEADRGEGISAETMLSELRAMSDEHVDVDYDLSEEEENDLDEAMAEMECGAWIEGDVVQQELRRRRGLA